MIVEPCNICGNTEVNLVDGFYYCVECGTQDVNVQETVVDKVVLASGVFAQSTSRKFNTVLAEGMEMSGEWYKWHAYNFILVGLANELISLGAPPSFKIKALWIWTRYINKIQVKDNVSSLGFDDEQNNGNDKEEKEKLQIKNKKIGKKIVNVTRCLLLTILYLALNFDGSEMQLSHLLRYMREGRLSLVDCIKFVPKEIKTKSIPNWMGFVLGTESPKEVTIRRMSMEVIKVLNLGLPKVPDIRKLVDNYVLELCMPDDFKNLVYSLLHFMPYDDWLEMNEDIKKSAATLPHYEAVAMAYVVLALKMCFGLDDVYELRLSDATDQINDNEMHMKSYKLGSHSQPSDRLFSFREWCKYLQFRKITLAKNYLPLAMDFSREVDDYALMEQSREYRPIRPILLSDDVAMNILNNIPEDKFSNIVSLEEFPPSVTPISTYTKAVLNNTDDPDIRLLLSEDFSQYSIKYVCENLKIPHDFNDVENIVVGVDEINKIVNNTITGTMTGTHGDVCSLVYVKNCDNKNWLISKPPTSDQVADINETENNDGNDSDNGYSSNIDNTPEKRNSDTGNSILENMKEYETNIDTIIEEPEEKSIFDDDFTGNDIEDSKIVEDENSQGLFESQNNQSINYVIPSDRDTNSSIGCRFDPDTFNRELTIRELVLAACKEYKIPVPKEYKPPKEPKEPRKRRSELIKFESEQDQEERPKRRKKRVHGQTRNRKNPFGILLQFAK